jgi:8-oxo-dGTP diphosphatase
MERKTVSVGRFRAGIGALIWDPETSRYLLLQRAPDRDFAPGAWECVTGRVDQGEGFEAALRREVLEEIGVSVQIDFILGTTHFYRGAAQPKNELVGVVYHCSLSDPQLVIDAEHTAFRWATLEEARALLDRDHPSEAWLLRVLARAEILRELLPSKLIDLDRQIGFELD